MINKMSIDGNSGVARKQFVVEISDTDVYINGKLCEFAALMDKTDHQDDLNKKAFVALAGEMGYEATFLFEEMAQRLEEMVHEPD